MKWIRWVSCVVFAIGALSGCAESYCSFAAANCAMTTEAGCTSSVEQLRMGSAEAGCSAQFEAVDACAQSDLLVSNGTCRPGSGCDDEGAMLSACCTAAASANCGYPFFN